MHIELGQGPVLDRAGMLANQGTVGQLRPGLAVLAAEPLAKQRQDRLQLWIGDRLVGGREELVVLAGEIVGGHRYLTTRWTQISARLNGGVAAMSSTMLITACGVGLSRYFIAAAVSSRARMPQMTAII